MDFFPPFVSDELNRLDMQVATEGIEPSIHDDGKLRESSSHFYQPFIKY